MKPNYCESCGMSLSNEELLGTNKDGSKNEEYCIYCYKDGAYTANCNMEEMIEISVKHMKEMDVLEQQNKTEEEAHAFMHTFFSNLKRWKK